MINQNIFTVKIGGQAGQGVKSAGQMLAKVATRSGFYIYNHTEYPSLIRGGHNIMQINISSDEIIAPSKKCDLLIALNQETIDLHQVEVEGGEIIFDEGGNINVSGINNESARVPIPLTKIAQESGGKELLSNTVALGAIIALLGGNLEILTGLINEEFVNKEAEVLNSNIKAAQAGFDYINKHFKDKIKQILAPKEVTEAKMIVNANDAIALGAISAGLQFASIYPMTPITSILQTLALHQEKYNYIYKQPEDEIAAINMAIGASHAGARSMVATSGGGFCLMTEGYGLSGITEIPLVIIEGMRPGPATGLPTWSGQGDLQFVLHSHQGDFPKIVLAAGDAKEAFELTMQAFNLADKYQTPVLLLVDKNICESDQSFPIFDTCLPAGRPPFNQINRGKLVTDVQPEYQRYTDSPDGISPRAIPGSGNFFIANSYEHDLVGFSTENIEDVNIQMKKRMKKLETCIKEDMGNPLLFGPKEAEVTIVSWGSNKGSILQALKSFDNVNFLHITWMNPFPTEAVRNILAHASYLLDIESNFTGQLASLIREKTGVEIFDKFLKFDGRPFFPEEIIDRLNSILKR